MTCILKQGEIRLKKDNQTDVNQTDCPVCYEELENEKPQVCGHVIHLDCLKKHFKPECPLCRTKLNIEVEGTFDGKSYREREYEQAYLQSYYAEDLEEYEEDYNEELEQYIHEENWRWRCRGFNYEEEDPEFDEENPRGDDWYYDDEE